LDKYNKTSKYLSIFILIILVQLLAGFSGYAHCICHPQNTFSNCITDITPSVIYKNYIFCKSIFDCVLGFFQKNPFFIFFSKLLSSFFNLIFYCCKNHLNFYTLYSCDSVRYNQIYNYDCGALQMIKIQYNLVLKLLSWFNSFMVYTYTNNFNINLLYDWNTIHYWYFFKKNYGGVFVQPITWLQEAQIQHNQVYGPGWGTLLDHTSSVASCHERALLNNNPWSRGYDRTADEWRSLYERVYYDTRENARPLLRGEVRNGRYRPLEDINVFRFILLGLEDYID